MRAITDDMIHMLLERLSKRNITIWTEAGKIKYKAPAGALTSEELQCIKENKEKIIKYLENHAIWSKGVKETFPLTSIQKAYLIGSDQAYELGGINAHYYMELNCCDIDVVRFERAVNEVIARTDAMRTIVLSNGMQAVLEKVPTYKIERFEFGNEKDREEKREQWSHCVFDLCKWPLYNIRISYVNKAFPRIHIDFDCIIMDAWSAKMMIAKIFEVYEGKIVKWGTYSFKQYCLEQKEYRETHPENAAYSYWRKRVTELPPAPDLPYKKKLSELCGHRFDRISQKFSREETSALYKLVKDNRVTPAALICTMYMKTLMQYSKNKEFSLNLTLFNRLPLSEEIYNLIGNFTNIGAIAYRQQKDFWQEVNFVQKQLWELVRYHSFDGTQILKMIDPMNRGKAILPVVFTGVLQGDRKTKGFLPNGISEGYAISQTPQVVLDYQATDFNGELLVNWDYVIDAFDVEMIHSMFSENIKGLRLLIYS